MRPGVRVPVAVETAAETRVQVRFDAFRLDEFHMGPEYPRDELPPWARGVDPRPTDFEGLFRRGIGRILT